MERLLMYPLWLLPILICLCYSFPQKTTSKHVDNNGVTQAPFYTSATSEAKLSSDLYDVTPTTGTSLPLISNHLLVLKHSSTDCTANKGENTKHSGEMQLISTSVPEVTTSRPQIPIAKPNFPRVAIPFVIAMWVLGTCVVKIGNFQITHHGVAS